MNRQAMEEVILQVERRIKQRDCPTIPSFRVSTLEEVIFDLAAENRELQTVKPAGPARVYWMTDPEADAIESPFVRQQDYEDLKNAHSQASGGTVDGG